MKCPYCGEKGAKVKPNAVCPERLIHAALDCRNPECTAYDPITHGYHRKMLAGKKEEFQRILRAVRNESYFDLIAIHSRRAKFSPSYEKATVYQKKPGRISRAFAILAGRAFRTDPSPGRC